MKRDPSVREFLRTLHAVCKDRQLCKNCDFYDVCTFIPAKSVDPIEQYIEKAIKFYHKMKKGK